MSTLSYLLSLLYMYSPTVKARCNDLNGEGVFNRYNEVIVTTDVGLSNHVPPLY
jgi:hypothetical protein